MNQPSWFFSHFSRLEGLTRTFSGSEPSAGWSMTTLSRVDGSASPYQLSGLAPATPASASFARPRAYSRAISLPAGLCASIEIRSPRGGALKKLLLAFRIGAGGRFGNGKQWQSWITLDDEIGAIEHLLTANVSGPVNLTAPSPVTNSEFTTVLAKVLRRPAILPIPSFGPKILLGAELADALLFTGQRVMPKALLASGYEFAHPTLDIGLRALLNK